MSLTVVGPPSEAETMLTTVAAVKDEIGIAQNDTSRDDYLKRLIRQASDEAVSYCHRPFARQRVRETGLEYRDGYVMVTLTPVTEVHQLSLNGQVVLGVEIEDADAGVLTGSGNALLGLGESRWWNDPFRASLGNLMGSQAVVEYTGGFVVPQGADPPSSRTLPYDLEAAVIALVAAALERSPAQAVGTGTPAIRSLKVDDINVTYEDGATGVNLATQVYDRLSRYRRVV